MAFEGLAGKLQNIFGKLTGHGKVSEKDVRDAMREVRLSLLEADVNYAVVRDFVKKVTERAVGAEILASLTPGQQVIKIVNEELTALMGGVNARLEFGSVSPSVILLVGLQGAGKTTMAAKLGGLLKKQGKKPLLVAADIYRPAAIDQLKIVGSQVDLPVFSMGTADPVEIVTKAREHAQHYFNDVMIVDTAGRLHVDEELMEELENIKAAVNPVEILLVVDAMTGQDAVNVAQSFNERLGITGVVLTKLDSDTRGGAAISVRAVTGRPIKFAGVGEKLTDIEPFHPDRMASRILGMGDVLSLIEKAEAAFDEKKAVEMEKKLRRNEFTLQDLLDQFESMKNLGSMQDILGMLPGASRLGDVQVDEKAMGRTVAILRSMTPKERRNPDLLNASRRRRIAAGSGNTVQDVNRLIKQYEQMKQMMKQFSGGRLKKGRFGGRGGFPFM
ncbi:MAG: signal recognition particle protein [Clostridia bacterium]|nr:signal recognition particle protein [Clostridia bacterium]